MEMVSRISKLYEALHTGNYRLPLNEAANFISDKLFKQSIDFNTNLIKTTTNFLIGDLHNIPSIFTENDLFLKLPYKQTIFEFSCNPEDTIRAYAICTDLNQIEEKYSTELTHRMPAEFSDKVSIYVHPLILTKNKEQFMVTSFSCPFVIGLTGNNQIAVGALLPEELNKPKAMELYNKGHISENNMTIACAVYYTLILLHTQNITTETIHPPKALCKSREKKGHTPLFSYKVLSVKKSTGKIPDDTDSRQLKEIEDDTKRASPRLHMRRGHIRRLHGGNMLIWIEQMVVGKGPGEVKKDYRLIF